jgi:tetratricopeptide (TPR) repeat protein
VGELREPALALDAAARALAETPDDLTLVDEVERLGAASGRPGEAAAAFEGVLELSLPSEAAREIGLRAARLHDTLGDDDKAEQRYLGVLALDPECADALSALERLYRIADDPAKLVSVLDRRAALELDPTARVALLSEVARLREGPLRDEPGAVEAWKKVLETEESNEPALTALGGLHEAAGRWRELVEVLEARARFVADTMERAELKARVGDLWAEQLDDNARAVEAWREVMDLIPDSLTALEALEELHGAAGDWLAVQEVLVRQLTVVGDGADQVPIYRRLAVVAVEKQKNPEDAIGYYQRVLELSPGDEQAHSDLESALAAQGKWYDLVEELTKHAERASSMGEFDREVALLVRAADVLESKLEDANAATEILEKILKRDPKNVRALGSLAKIYEASGDLDRCKETLERAVSLATTAPEVAQLFFRLGVIEDRRTGDGAGEPYFERALQYDPHLFPAIEALEKLAREREEWARLADLLALRAERADVLDPAGQRALYLELAKLHAERLGQPEDALPYLERAREAAPNDVAVIEQLADGYLAADRFAEAQPMYLALIEQTLAASKGRRTKELARLHTRVAEVAERLGDGARALEQYQAAYQIDAGNPATLAALGRLFMDQQEWEKARRMYRSLLLQNIDPSTGVRKAEVYLALGEIHERTNEAPKAVGMYERGLELEPHNERLREALARARSAR